MEAEAAGVNSGLLRHAVCAKLDWKAVRTDRGVRYLDASGCMGVIKKSSTSSLATQLFSPIRTEIMSESDPGFQAALEEAKQGAREGGIPIGACLVDKNGKVLGRGHNMRLQKGSAILHVRRLLDTTSLQDS